VIGPSAEGITETTTRLENRFLTPQAARMVSNADTFFIASASRDPRTAARSEGVDVSHRGGPPGFVRVLEEPSGTVLLAPDYRGNFMFNTLGNILANPRAGVLFLNFDDGSLLSLTGAAEVVHDGPLVATFPHAERLLRFEVHAGYSAARRESIQPESSVRKDSGRKF
jgi:predicted pyridoxine 5'-phosphate oxidase superfamily flavin-nucleotide-binding protein